MTKQITENTKTRLFWILNISGWLLLYLIYVVLYYRDYLTDFPKMATLLIGHVTGFLLSFFLRYIYKKSNYHKKSIPFILALLTVASIIIANLWFWFDMSLTLTIREYDEIYANLNTSTYFSYIWSNTFVLFAWSALYFSINFWYDFQKQKLRTEQANSLAQSAQLQMLRYQLNPHFLFNSLNSIRALVEEDKKRAKGMITELAEFLRYSLVSKNYTDVPFQDELEAMKHYLAIEKTRYEEKLELKFDIDPSAESYPVLSFLIHPIIENALKYGMKTSKMPLNLLISAKVEENVFKVSICNSGKWVDKSDSEGGTGTGLDNVKGRLQNAFPGRHKFDIEVSDDKVCVKIEIKN